ncbi:hypothetical protein REPUB_Repub03eG0021500 [Reevesia pubescens]
MSHLSHGKLVYLPPRIRPSVLSYHSRVDFLKLNLYPGLGLLSSLEHGSGKLKLQSEPRAPSGKFHQPCSLVVRCNHPQNADLPRYYSKKEKKLFPVPIVELSYCNEIHVGPVGHPFKSCRGQHASIRKGLHEWTYATVEDVFLQVDAYHLYDRLGKRIRHDERFSIPRIPAVVELCIQAGVDVPEFPTKRRRKPIIRIGKKEFVDADESELPDPVPEVPLKPILTEMPDSEIVAPHATEETILLAEETLQAWEQMRRGAKKLMRMYPVRVCGYCPEVHVGPSGHKAQNCGAHKHQQRNGQHGWQAAVLDDLIPPRYVWHVPDVNGLPLQQELRSFYGQAPAVVEICVRAGTAVPDQYKPTMRLDIGIPTNLREAEMVV